MKNITPAIWFPTVKTHTGTDVFTIDLVEGLNKKGIRAEIYWLPHHAEYAPFLTKKITPPEWANIVHVNSWLNPKYIPNNLPTITTVHLCIQDKQLNSYKNILQRLYHNLWITPIERKNINNAKQVTTVSKYTQIQVEKFFNLKKTICIYNGINTNIFLNKKNKIKNEKFTILFASTNSIRKGFDLLPNIMNKLGTDFELLYISKDKKNNLPQNMKHIPYINEKKDLSDLLNRVDALIFPSRLEGFGLIVAEAMACELPVVAANTSALPELITNNQTGFLCQLDEVEEFTKIIKSLKENPNIYKSIGKNSREEIKLNFSFDSMVDKYLKLYENILN